jgi:hypothetical protein
VSFRDQINNLIPIPVEWQARSEWDGTIGTVTTGLIEPTEKHEDLLRQFDYDPEKVEITGTVNQWRKQLADGTWRISYFFKVQSKDKLLDLPALYAASAKLSRKVTKPPVSSRVTVVVLADCQIGKTGSRGGSPELVERLADTRVRLAAHLKERRPESTVLAEAGDIFEGFNSGGNPMFTNDLSLAQQMDMASTEIYEFVKVMSPHGRVDVMAVPSNHTAWRNGKQYLGRPGDDLGLLCHKQIRKVTEAAGIDAHWHFPGYHDEAVIHNVNGTVLGMVHGNQYSPGAASVWWAKQQHGGQPVGSADILVSGHYHHLRIEPTGRNPNTGRSKWWLQAPTLDNGSDWYRNLSGDDSDPGLLVFDIDADGFDLKSLVIL